MKRMSAALTVLALVSVIAACSETWSGVKEDTRENTRAVGQGVQDVGKKIEKQAE
jgi:Entericidin EcnA/B family.